MIVVLADDFSGAAEVAGAAVARGLTAEVHVDRLYPSNCDVVVIDSNTRPCTEEDARRIVTAITQQIREAAPALVFKKVDSLLRGPVGMELSTIRTVLDKFRTVLANANPRKGRCVSKGRILIDNCPVNESDFRWDPEHPRHTAHVGELLQCDCEVESIGPNDLVSQNALGIVEASLSEDLISAARFYIRQQDDVLLAGGAEFFEALLDVQGWQITTASQKLCLQWETLIVRGSAAGQSVLPDLPAVQVDLNDQIADTATNLCGILAAGGKASLEICQQQPLAEPLMETSTSLHQKLIQTTELVRKTCHPRHVWIEGGHTASSVVRAFGCERLQVTAVFGDGVVGLQDDGTSSPSFVVKPGSYAWPIEIHAVSPRSEVPA